MQKVLEGDGPLGASYKAELLQDGFRAGPGGSKDWTGPPLLEHQGPVGCRAESPSACLLIRGGPGRLHSRPVKSLSHDLRIKSPIVSSNESFSEAFV